VAPVVAAALAASVLLAISAVWQLQSQQQQAAPQYHRVRLSLVTQTAGDVRLALTLPAGVRPLGATRAALDGDTLRFSASLRPGRNELDLPLTSRGAGGQLRLQVTYQGRSWTSKLQLSKAQASVVDGSAAPMVLALRLEGRFVAASREGGRR
jgi:hypothetical protein